MTVIQVTPPPMQIHIGDRIYYRLHFLGLSTVTSPHPLPSPPPAHPYQYCKEMYHVLLIFEVYLHSIAGTDTVGHIRQFTYVYNLVEYIQAISYCIIIEVEST